MQKIEAVLGAVIQCSNKEKYVNDILTLSDDCQDTLMLIIEKIISKYNSKRPGAEGNRNSNNSFEKFKESPTRAETFFGKADSLEKNLLVKFEELENENQQLNQKLNNMSQEREILKTKIDDLNQEMEKRNQEIKHLVNDRDKTLRKVNIL